jgi:hypothetical protein
VALSQATSPRLCAPLRHFGSSVDCSPDVNFLAIVINPANAPAMSVRLVPSAIVSCAASLLLVSSARADADSLTDNLGPREIAVGEALRGGAIGSSSVTMNPAGVALNHEMVFEGGFGYRPMDSASLFAVSACDSTGGIPGCFFYNYAGTNTDLDGTTTSHRSHSGGLTMSRPISQRVMIGSTIRYLSFKSSTMDESASGVNWDAGLAARLAPSLNLGVTGHNLYGTKSAQFPRAIGAGLLFRPSPTLTATFDARWKLDGENKTGRFGGGLEYFVSTGAGQTAFPLRAGVLYDRALGATYVSAGVGYATMKTGLDIAARREVKGGNETIVIASLRFYGPRQAAGEPFAQ